MSITGDARDSAPVAEGGQPLTIVSISALEHYSYCPRQCALIHVEGCYLENKWTAQGSVAHQRVDTDVAWRGGRTMRAMVLFSDRRGLIGRADAVEMEAGGVPYPVEYKSGPARDWIHEAIQLCAQAMCLEEMFDVVVPAGAVYYAASHRRREIVLTDELRERTDVVIAATRRMIEDGVVPIERFAPRCRRCSLRPACVPEVTGRPRAVAAHMRALRTVDDA